VEPPRFAWAASLPVSISSRFGADRFPAIAAFLAPTASFLAILPPAVILRQLISGHTAPPRHEQLAKPTTTMASSSS
jgi:hypothetical protein